jgi:hypothetical protein
MLVKYKKKELMSLCSVMSVIFISFQTIEKKKGTSRPAKLQTVHLKIYEFPYWSMPLHSCFTIYARAIRKVTSSELLEKQTMKKNILLYTKN